ncbi:hypothetical protein [Alsobacter sp. R-9]
MRKTMLAALAAVVMGGAGAALAFEDPPATTADFVLGAKATGPNYRVEQEVRSDGLMHLFVLRTTGGTYDIGGNDLMKTRIRELEALRKLQAMSESDVFVKSLAQTAAAPLEFGADLIKDPGATLKRSASGVANMFGRLGAAIDNRSSNRDNAVTSVLGVDAARRALAVQLDVDPYTDFPPLAAKLGDIASASAFGGLTVKGLLMLVPGGAGVVVSSASTADTIRNTLRDRTAAQVIEIVRGSLQKNGVPPPVTDRLVQNRAYTPADLLIMSEALGRLKAGNTRLFVSRAANAATREEALFQRHRAMLLADRAGSLGIGAFTDVGGFPLNRLKDGRILALMPLDSVSWTPNVAAAFGRMADAAKGEATGPVLMITGSVTPMAEQAIRARGWSVERAN